MHVGYETPGPDHATSLLLHVAIAFQGYRAFAPEGWEPPDELTPGNVDRVAGELADPSAYALMAVYEGDPVGHVLWVPARTPSPGDETVPEGMIHLRHLFVLEPWWGTGVARTLHERAVEAMAGRPARLFTPSGQLRARRFYEREGWRLHDVRFDERFGLDLAEYRR